MDPRRRLSNIHQKIKYETVFATLDSIFATMTRYSLGDSFFDIILECHDDPS